MESIKVCCTAKAAESLVVSRPVRGGRGASCLGSASRAVAHKSLVVLPLVVVGVASNDGACAQGLDGSWDWEGGGGCREPLCLVLVVVVVVGGGRSV